MIDLIEVKRIVINEVEESKVQFDYYECFLSSRWVYNDQESIIENVIHFFICTPLGEAEISGNFGTEIELRCLIRNVLNTQERKNEYTDNNDIVRDIDLPDSEYQLLKNVTEILISKEYFNSKGISKIVSNRFFIDRNYSRKFLFCRKQPEEIYQDLVEENRFIKNTADCIGTNTWIIAPRVVHKIVSNTFSKLIYNGDENLVKMYLDTFNVFIRFANAPNADESICHDFFDLYGKNYSDKVYISDGHYQEMEKNDERYEIINGSIKKGFQFAKLEMDSIFVEMKKCLFFYDFVGKIDIYSNYICGMLLGEKVEKKIETKLSAFFSDILGACGKMTNVKYIYTGSAPYVAMREM